MSLFKLFSAKSPRAYEQKGDAYANDALWGNAKVEYERALDRLEKTEPRDRDSASRLEGKILRACEALALEHKNSAAELIAGGYPEEARDLIDLALELTRDSGLENALQNMLSETEKRPYEKGELADWANGMDEDTFETGGPDDEDEYFFALCATLPDEVQMAYLGYGRNFKTGYLALNAGDFETAAQNLTLALEENREYDTYIPLELATAFLNQAKTEAARQLLESFIEGRPDALPAYQLLCEILWENGEFEQAKVLLASLPEGLRSSLAATLLQGETLYQAHDFPAAKVFYSQVLDAYGWNEAVARELAKTHEALGETDDAVSIYSNIMDSCRSCHARIDPRIKEKFADLSFASGTMNTTILELYLSLAQEIPDNAWAYYQKVSQIYASQGNRAEAARFKTFSEELYRLS